MAKQFKLIYKFNIIPIIIPTALFWRTWQDDLKIYREMHRTSSKQSWKRKATTLGDSHFSVSKLTTKQEYQESAVVKIRDRCINQWSIIKSP